MSAGWLGRLRLRLRLRHGKPAGGRPGVWWGLAKHRHTHQPTLARLPRRRVQTFVSRVFITFFMGVLSGAPRGWPSGS